MWREVFFRCGKEAAPLIATARKEGAAGLVRLLELMDELAESDQGRLFSGDDAGLGDKLLSFKRRGGPQYLVTVNDRFTYVQVDLHV